MDPFYAFLLFALVLAMDLLFASAWIPAYYRVGIPIFSRQRQITSTAEAKPLAERLNGLFSARPEHPSIRFKALSAGEVALRERLFENRAGFRYLPILHGLMRLRPERNAITLTGYANGYTLVALAYAAYRSAQDTTFLPVAILILGVLGMSLFTQFSLYNRILDEASSAEQPTP